jgi:thioredoxin-related protein
MMRILLVAILFLFGIGNAIAETRDAQEHFFDAKMGDFKSELANAKKEGKTGVLIMFELDDCPFCFRMKQTILNQSEVQDYYHKHFLIYPVDLKGDVAMVDFQGKATTEKAFGLEQRIYGTPVFDFFDLEGNRIVRFPGAAKDANEFLLLGKYVVEGAYTSMPFAKYKRQGQGPQ